MKATSKNEFNSKINNCQSAYMWWRDVPAPKRGELIRLFGNALRRNKEDIADLIVDEARKIYSEAMGEVQEVIDMCDFAVGLSRQIGGLTLPSERPNHSMQERWHPLGIVGVISAFNFPVAVWGWNFCLAIICGNAVVWKPSDKTEKCAEKCLEIWNELVEEHYSNDEAKWLLQIVYGSKKQAEWIADNKKVALVSATGSCAMGKNIYQRVAKRLGKCLLELGGNNAAIISNKADIDLAVKACTFGAVGTAGQRCTTLRRAFVHKDVYKEFVSKMKKAYASIAIGDPKFDGILMGPVIDENSCDKFEAVIAELKKLGGVTITGGKVREKIKDDGREGFDCYLEPAIVEIPAVIGLMDEETFGPLLYVMKYTDLDTAIAIQNNVPQGLSSCIFTKDVQEMEHFISAHGSDCGIANINIGPSGAEIGGAFGGEKDTGGGRESGSDSWKNYMRRQTITINYGNDLPLAQGIEFNLS